MSLVAYFANICQLQDPLTLYSVRVCDVTGPPRKYETSVNLCQMEVRHILQHSAATVRIEYQPPAVEQRLIIYSVMSVCLCVIDFCKQDISKTDLWTFAKLVADIPYKLPWKSLTFGVVTFSVADFEPF